RGDRRCRDGRARRGGREVVSPTVARRARLVGLGLFLDRGIGEPPDRVHPVAAFGSLMHRIESAVYADDRRAGCRYTAIGVALGAAAGALARTPMLAVATASAGRQLRMEATRVRDELRAGDVPRARTLLPA